MVSYHQARVSIPERHTPDYEKEDHNPESGEGVENGEETGPQMETEQSPKMLMI